MAKLHNILSLVLLFIMVFTTFCYAKLAGQIMVDPSNPSWLVYNRDTDKDGKLDPAFICGPGDPEDFLYRGHRNSDGTRSGDQQFIINNIIAQGGNSIYFQVIRSHGGDGDPTHNPYIGSNPVNGLDGDILTQWDGWLSQLDQGGVVIYFFFYDDSARIWSGNTVNASEKLLIDQLVQRYQHLKNIVWVVAEEYSERYSPTRVSNIAKAIKLADNNDHVVANHQLSSLIFDHPNDSNLDQFALQYNKTSVEELHSGMVTAWNNAAGRYGIMMAESVDHGNDSRTECRQKNWSSAMAGAYVMVLRMDGTSPFNEKMNDCSTLASFFKDTDFNSMSPHDELGNSGTWVLANPGTSYIAYRITSGQFSLSGLTSGTYLVRWLDTLTGITVEKLLTLAHSSHTLVKPTSIGTEAAVWLTKISPNIEGPESNSPHQAPINSLLLKIE